MLTLSNFKKTLVVSQKIQRKKIIFKNYRKAEDGKLLTSKETRQLQKEWMKRYNPGKGKEHNSDEEVSQYDNVKKER